MSERIHAAVGSSMARRKWTLVIAGTAVLLLGAGVALQVTRPTSAFPEEGAGSRTAQSGRATTGETSQRAKAMALVGGQPITYDELAAECIRRHGEEILDNLINRRIIQQACDAQAIEVSEAEVDAEVNKIAKKFQMDSPAYLQMLQTERNVTPAQYRRDIIWPMLALKKLAGEEIKITSDELKKAFIRNYGPRVKARAIVLDNSRRAAEVWKLATDPDNPDDFESLAAKHSVDPSSRHLGGMIPPIPRYAGSEEVEKAAFKMKEGDVSAVIQVGLNQFIILKCEGRTVPAVDKMDKEIESILRDQLTEEKIQESVARVFQKVKDEARVDNHLTGTSTSGARKPVAVKAGAAKGDVRQTGATGTAGATRKGAKPTSDTESEQVPAVPQKAPVRGTKPR